MAAAIRDVAQLAGVSISTVSRLLNNKASLSENTRQRIYGAIEQLNYVPHPSDSYKAPDRADEQVFYQIFPKRFCSGDGKPRSFELLSSYSIKKRGKNEKI